MGSLGKANTLASEIPNPLPQLRLRGLDLTRQGAPGASFPLSIPIDGAWPDRFTRHRGPEKLGRCGSSPGYLGGAIEPGQPGRPPAGQEAKGQGPCPPLCRTKNPAATRDRSAPRVVSFRLNLILRLSLCFFLRLSLCFFQNAAGRCPWCQISGSVPESGSFASTESKPSDVKPLQSKSCSRILVKLRRSRPYRSVCSG